MNIRIKVKEKDYLHFAYAAMRKWIHPALFGAIIILLILFILFLSTPQFDPRNPILKYVELIIPVILATIIFFAILIPKLKKAYRTNAFLQDEISFTFHPNLIHVETPISTAEVNSSMIRKIRQSKKILAIYVSSNTAYLFPKDQLSDTEKQYLHEWLKLSVNSSIYKDPRIS